MTEAPTIRLVSPRRLRRARRVSWTAATPPPNELPLHTEVLRRRPDVDVVVHAHPAAVVAAPTSPAWRSGRSWGRSHIPGTRLAAGGVPV